MSRGAREPETTAPARARDRRTAGAVFLILLALYAATASGLPDNPDAEVEFQTASALARTGATALRGTPEATEIVAQRFDVVPGGPGREGRWYGWFGVGQALVALPFYAVGSGLAAAFPAIEARHAQSTAYGVPRSEYFEHLAVGLRNPLCMALAGALLASAALRLGARRRTAFAAALAFGLATFAWPQARSTLSDVQATALLMLAFHELLAARARFAGGEGAALARLALGGFAIGFLVLTRVALGGAAAVLAVAWAIVLARAPWRARLAWAAPIAACAALFLALNRARFGDPFATGYGAALQGGTFFAYPPLLGLAGLLAAPGKGLLWMAPGLVLLPFGLGAARARGEKLWPRVLAACALAIALPVACTQTWHGAWTYGPRYLLPLVPLAWLAVPLALDFAPRRRLVRGLCAAAVALGLATSLPGVLVDHMTHQELALAGAREAWPAPGGKDAREQDDARFLLIQWDWRFAAPWAHWRILRHRLAQGDDDFALAELFMLPGSERCTPAGERERGWRHFAWVDLEQRLGGSAWPALAACAALLLGGVALARGALADPVQSRPAA